MLLTDIPEASFGANENEPSEHAETLPFCSGASGHLTFQIDLSGG